MTDETTPEADSASVEAESDAPDTAPADTAPAEPEVHDPDAQDSDVQDSDVQDSDVHEHGDTAERLRDDLEALREERDDLEDRLLRKAAEVKNIRRRMEREKRRRHRAGKVTVLESMLEVLDDFERSLDAAHTLQEADDPASAYDSLKGGVEMVFEKFQDQLAALGVEPIAAEGEPFDEHLHEAMMRQPSEDAEPGTVLNEVQKGYTLGDRVLRHSRVVVATEPPEDNAD
jgi:molecular chaperone GrpE